MTFTPFSPLSLKSFAVNFQYQVLSQVSDDLLLPSLHFVRCQVQAWARPRRLLLHEYQLLQFLLQYTVLHNDYFFHLAFISSSSVKMFPFSSKAQASRHISLGVGFLVSDLMCLNMSLVFANFTIFSWQQTTVDRTSLYARVCRMIGCSEIGKSTSWSLPNQDEVPVEVIPGSACHRSSQGKVCPQHNYEEAGNIIVQQAIRIAANEKRYVRVLVDDTDVYS